MALAATKMVVYGFSIVAPLAFFILMFVLVSRFHLEKKIPGMKKEIAKRKKEKNESIVTL